MNTPSNIIIFCQEGLSFCVSIWCVYQWVIKFSFLDNSKSLICKFGHCRSLSCGCCLTDMPEAYTWVIFQSLWLHRLVQGCTPIKTSPTSSANWKLKQQWNTPTQFLEWLKSETLKQSVLARMWISRNSHLLLLGMQNGIRKQSSIFLQSKHSTAIWSGNYALCYLSKWFENICPHRTYTHMFIVTLFRNAKN